MVIFYKKWKKYNEIQLAKNKMDLNIRKMTNHPPSPVHIKRQYILKINKNPLENRQSTTQRMTSNTTQSFSLVNYLLINLF